MIPDAQAQTPDPVLTWHNDNGRTGQGYWGSPAYWEWTSGGPTTRAIYYSVDATTDQPDQGANRPQPINMYTLQTAGSIRPIPSTHYDTATFFCAHGGAPVISANGSTPGSGIVWAIEANNTNNPRNLNCNGDWGPAVLHAYDASNVSNTELCHSQMSYQNNTIPVGPPSNFATPLVFNHRVYMVTKTEVNVFGLCSQSLPCKPYEGGRSENKINRVLHIFAVAERLPLWGPRKRTVSYKVDRRNSRCSVLFSRPLRPAANPSFRRWERCCERPDQREPVKPS